MVAIVNRVDYDITQSFFSWWGGLGWFWSDCLEKYD